MNLTHRGAIDMHILEVDLGSAVSALLYLTAVAEEGYFGVEEDEGLIVVLPPEG